MEGVYNPARKHFTWYIYTRVQAQKGQATGNRIDFFLTSQEFTLHAREVDILPAFKTDHAIPLLTLSKIDKASSLPIWHFPSFVLDERSYYDVLNRAVQETLRDNPGSSASTLWKVMKCNIRLATDRFRYIIEVKRKRKTAAFEQTVEGMQGEERLYVP